MIWNGEAVRWVSVYIDCLITKKSTERCGEPSFLAVATMTLHQSVGVLTGSGAIMPCSTSLSKAADLKRNGIGIRMCHVLGRRRLSKGLG